MADVEKIEFARKYRPRTMDDYIGENVKRRIMGIFGEDKKPPSTILMKGSSGCGKTSAARLMCKEYFCENKVNGHACGVCPACEEIDHYIVTGEPVEGIIEVDITSDNTKSKLDNILADAMRPALGLPYKVLILDECHRADKGAQNRLLKVMEEPPEHLIFILCTTDPDDLIPTLRGRCRVNIEVTKPSIEDMSNYLVPICKKEGIKTSIEALKMITKYKERVPRECLNLLEEIATVNGNVVTLDIVNHHIGNIGNDIYLEYFRASNKSLGAIIKFMAKLKADDVKMKNFLNGLLKFTMDCLYIRYGTRLEDYPPEFIKSVKKLFTIYNEDELDILLQILEHALKMSVNAGDAEYVIMTTATRIGKIKILSESLRHEKEQAQRENSQSVVAYADKQKKEKAEKNKARVVKADDNIMASIFGKNLVDIKEPIIEDRGLIDEEEEEEDDKIASQQDIINAILGDL